MLDAVIDFLPSPVDIPAGAGTAPDTKRARSASADDEPKFRPRVQDHDRPVRRPAHLRARLFGRVKSATSV